MVKSDKKKIAAVENTHVKKRKVLKPGDGTGMSKRGDGIDEFDILFSEKKRQDKQIKEDEEKKEAHRKAAKKARYQNDGASSTSTKSRIAEMSGPEWVDDGLGGKYNHEGYTGRIEDGVKIFKRHILNKPGAGNTKDCPFDCNCCFI